MAFLPLALASMLDQHRVMTTNTTDLVPALPDNPLAHAALALVTSTEPASIANHSIRSYLFASLLADHRGVEMGRDLDPQLLFLACVLHDIGLTADGDREQRFEVDGADLAAEFLTAEGFPAAAVDGVWEAIALHTSPGIAERRGALSMFTRAGVGLDFGRDADFVTDEQAAAIHAAYPRLAMATSLADAIVAQAQSRPAKPRATPSPQSCCASGSLARSQRWRRAQRSPDGEAETHPATGHDVHGEVRATSTRTGPRTPRTCGPCRPRNLMTKASASAVMSTRFMVPLSDGGCSRTGSGVPARPAPDPVGYTKPIGLGSYVTGMFWSAGRGSSITLWSPRPVPDWV